MRSILQKPPKRVQIVSRSLRLERRKDSHRTKKEGNLHFAEHTWCNQSHPYGWLLYTQTLHFDQVYWQKLGFPGGSGVKNRLPMQETWARYLCWEDPLEKEMVTHSSILAQQIPWTEKVGGLQSRGSQRAGHDSATKKQHWQKLRIQCN